MESRTLDGISPLAAAAGRGPALFILSASGLLLELTLTRVFSATQWYHFAFLVVAVAMLGLGAGAVTLALRPGMGERDPDLFAGYCALGAAGSAILAGGFAAAAPLDLFRVAADPAQFFWLGGVIVAAALPFACISLATGRLLIAVADRPMRLYAWDLAGSGAGSVLFPFVIAAAGGVGAAACAGALALGSGALFIAGRERALALAAGACAGALLLTSPWVDGRVPLRPCSGKIPGRVLADSETVRFSGWNALSRIDVLAAPPGAVDEPPLKIWVDAGASGTALVPAPGGPSAQPPRHTVEDPLLALFPRPQVLVLGSGGGGEVLSSLVRGARHVTAVEINPLISRLASERFAAETGNIFSDPRVELVVDDARGALARSRRHYDVILSIHTTSGAATAAGALALAENHVLTREGLVAICGRLHPDGVLLITRPEAQLPVLARALGNLAEEKGVGRARDRVLLFRAPGAGLDARGRSFVSGIVYRLRPFDPEEARELASAYRTLGMEVLHTPDGRLEHSGYSPLLHGRAAGVQDPGVTDDRPYLESRVEWTLPGMARLARTLFGGGRGGRLASESEPYAEASVLAAGLLTTCGALLTMGLGRRAARRLRAGYLPPWGAAYFALSSFGFIVAELGLVHILTLPLGSPATALMVVLGGLLVCSGLGSASARPGKPYAPPRTVRRRHLTPAEIRAHTHTPLTGAPLAAGVVIMLAALLAGVWSSPLLQLPLAARIVACLTVAGGVGFVAGRPFPLGLAYFASENRAGAGWAWAVATTWSVAGAALAVFMSLAWGHRAVLLVAALAYAAAWFAACLAVLSAIEEDPGE